MKKYIHFIVILIIIVTYSQCKNNISQKISNTDISEQKLVSLQGDTLLLKDCIKGKTLIFRYSVLDCKSCIDSVFSYIRNYEGDIGITNIYILTYFNEFRHFVINARLNQINYAIYLLPNNNLNLIKEEDNNHIPYFFIIDENYNISNLLKIYNFGGQKSQIEEYLKNVVPESFKSEI